MEPTSWSILCCDAACGRGPGPGEGEGQGTDRVEPCRQARWKGAGTESGRPEGCRPGRSELRRTRGATAWVRAWGGGASVAAPCGC
jgi:hypothetical protein